MGSDRALVAHAAVHDAGPGAACRTPAIPSDAKPGGPSSAARPARYANRLGLLLLWLAVASGSAVAAQLPTSICTGKFCNLAQERMWDSFQSAGGLDMPLIPSVYSGICYHHSPYLDPDQINYAAVLIDDLDDRVGFDARFSFNQTDNPYRELNVTMAARRFARGMDGTRALELYPRHAYADLTGPLGGPFRYWLRQHAQDQRLFLVGYFGFRHTILCELDRHPA